jgi:hypothetical protein
LTPIRGLLTTIRGLLTPIARPEPLFDGGAGT